MDDNKVICTNLEHILRRNLVNPLRGRFGAIGVSILGFFGLSLGGFVRVADDTVFLPMTLRTILRVCFPQLSDDSSTTVVNECLDKQGDDSSNRRRNFIYLEVAIG